MGNSNATVLVAADDPAVVAGLRAQLTHDYCVETTTNGDETLAAIEDVDAVLVDRTLRTAAGTLVVAEIEGRPAARTTSVVYENKRETTGHTDIGDRLARPVAKADLVETVDRLLRRSRYDELIHECARLAAKRGTLEARSNGRNELESDGEYAALGNRLEDVFSELDELMGTFDGDDFRAAFETCAFDDSSAPQPAGDVP